MHWPFLKVDGINGQNSERDWNIWWVTTSSHEPICIWKFRLQSLIGIKFLSRNLDLYLYCYSSSQSLPLSFMLNSKLATIIHTQLKACHFHSYSTQSLPLSFILNSKLATFIHTHLKACYYHWYSTQSLPLSFMLNSKLATFIHTQLKACHFHSYALSWVWMKVASFELSMNESGKLWVEYEWKWQALSWA
jgi:hypothetical protein